MSASPDVVVRVLAGPGDEAADLAEQAGSLRRALLELDVADVAPARDGEAPAGAKGLGEIAGWLVLHLGGEQLSAVLDLAARWASSRGRAVKVVIDGDELKLGHATREQQEAIVSAFLTRHADRA